MECEPVKKAVPVPAATVKQKRKPTLKNTRSYGTQLSRMPRTHRHIGKSQYTEITAFQVIYIQVCRQCGIYMIP